jgi:phosphatidylinositol glycan class V
MWELVGRVVTILGAVLSDVVFPDHQATGVERVSSLFSSNWKQALLPAFQKWDAAHYIKLATGGYTDENQVAFSPFYPRILKFVGNLFVKWFGGTVMEGVVMAGMVVNIAAFIAATFILRKLLPLITPYKKGNRIFEIAIVIWCFNPAGIFFSTLYTESLFALLSWSAFMFFETHRTALCMVMFFLASMLRSNGTLNAVVVVAAWLSDRYRQREHRKSPAQNTIDMVRLGLICLSIILPSVLYNILHMHMLCGPAPSVPQAKDEVVPYLTSMATRYLLQQWGGMIPKSPLTVSNETTQLCSSAKPWHRLMPNYAYSHIQSKYWNVGLFRYWHWKQIPNFLLAAPIVYIAVYTIQHFDEIFGQVPDGKKNDDAPAKGGKNAARGTAATEDRWQRMLANPAFPYAAHLLVLLCVGLFFANVQITTRLLCASSPIIFVGMAHLYSKQRSAFKTNWVVWYLVLYNVLGAVLHSNHFPWT